MSAKILTAEQRAAVEAEGETLVSASAGSGKTFVMIEKIISLILEGKAQISGVLAVTFTNLAAAEMKEKLKRAIVGRINEETDEGVKSRLKYELSEIGASDICTLHSFCANLIRRYFYVTDENGDFQIADDADASEMKNRAAEIATDALLEQKSEKFQLLLRLYAGSKGLKRLTELFLPLYEKMRVHADYRARLENMPARFTEETFHSIADTLFSGLKVRLTQLRARVQSLAEETEYFVSGNEMSPKYLSFLAEIQALCLQLERAEDLYAAAALAKESKLSSKPPNGPLKKAENAPALRLDAHIDGAKNAFKEILIELKGYENEGEDLARYLRSGEIAAALCELLLAFDDAYAAVKKRAGKLDFSDLEHRTLALLSHEMVEKELKSRYTHVFVDEYQDVNPCQESILRALQGENMFMVGDVKQSIYGFRGCSARFFGEKFERLSACGKALVLNGNFRSAPRVLDAVNLIFSEVMTKRTGAVDYKNTSVMTASDRFPKNSGEVWLDFIPEEEEKTPEERDVYSVIGHLNGGEEKTDAEGAYIASVIAAELHKKHFDADSGEFVQNDYKDIVVLSRSKTGRAAKIIAELVRRGIPVASAAEYNICEYPEIKRLIEILRYLDCAEQDIPLAAALKSALGKLTDEELADIRLAAGSQKSFVEACREYAEAAQNRTGEKLRAFYAQTQRLRLLANVRSAAELLAGILSESGEEIEQLRAENGEERVKRIDRFLSECGALSVSDVLRRLKNNRYQVGFSEAGGENAVRVMTMHASKGLEFPVVIVAGMDNRFDDRDFKEKILTDEEWGFAPLSYNEQNFTAYDTILRALFRERMTARRAEDEMRLLYVAATRAQYCMHFIFREEGEFDFARVGRASKFSDFIPFEKFRDRFLQLESADFVATGERPLLISSTDEAAEREISLRYRAPYPYASSLEIPVKSSASAILKRQGERFYAEKELFPEDTGGSKTDKETGIAYHAFLERADFFAPPEREAERIFALFEKTRPELAAKLNRQKMARILAFPLFGNLRGFTLYREQEFLLSLPANALFATDSEDEVLVQGAIDLLAVRGDEALIIDYKYSTHSDERLVRDYARQLEIYAAAVGKIAKIEKISAHIVNLDRLSCVHVPLH